MYLDTLSIINFKNIREAQVECSPRINCFVGDNGTGKTNLLDAIYYLSVCKSALGLSDTQCTTHNQEMFAISGKYIVTTDGRSENISSVYRRGQTKKMSRGAKEYEKLSDHIGLIPIVMISPSDTVLIHESGEERRKYLNSLISQMDRDYLAALIKYNRLLAERNKLLKAQITRGFSDIMEVIDMQIAPLGTFICEQRARFVSELAPLVERYYSLLSGGKESVGLIYRSELCDAPYEDLLREAAQRDRINMFTTCGIHRDDLKMTLNGQQLRKFGSQGQQKSYLIALKLAQYDVVSHGAKHKPILLLDDIFDRLDTKRVEQLIGIVANGRFSQIFITDCNKVRLENILNSNGFEYKLFTVTDGEVAAGAGQSGQGVAGICVGANSGEVIVAQGYTEAQQGEDVTAVEQTSTLKEESEQMVGGIDKHTKIDSDEKA